MNLEWNESEVDKFENMFFAKYQEYVDLRDQSGEASHIANCEERWASYLVKYGIFVMGLEEVKKVWNRRPYMICIENPAEDVGDGEEIWYLVPKKFAEQCLILGGLP